MRFIGNKDTLLPEIHNLLYEKNLLDLDKEYIFLDAFCGTGSVSNHFKQNYDLIINDLLNWCVIYSKGRINIDKCQFEKLGFDPIDFLNTNNQIIKGFFYLNYSPGGSDRMYFTKENAGRIDYFRITIEDWYKKEMINKDEYFYLLACLLESVSLVANVAGVYGAFLKHWDKRALKDIEFVEVNHTYADIKIKKGVKSFNDKIEDIIEDIDCDILYLDPPYTQNQYGTQYHLLETLVLYDNPSISPVTGSRKTAPMRSDWSKNFKSHILLDKVVSKTKAKHIILSYSSDGFMSKQYIEAVFKRYGKEETFSFKEIPYSKYKNYKTKRKNEHYEYLFYIEKKDIEEVLYESPLNYTGSKYKMISEIKELLPKNISEFIDLFGGGFNVGVNIDAKKIIYNDINWLVKDIVKSFEKYDTYNYLMYINRIEKRFGLEAGNKESYIKARNYYNSLPENKRDPRLLYTIILYGFNQQIRFNSSYEFNNPVGMRWFNDNILEKFISFSRILKEKNIEFTSYNFNEFINEVKKDTFVYMDPPYRLTTGSYNDGKRGFNGWTKEEENELRDFIDFLDKKGIKFMLSYVLEHKGRRNEAMEKWIHERKYNLIELGAKCGGNREEVIVVNYEIL